MLIISERDFVFNEIQEILREIENLRANLDKLATIKNNIIDEVIISKSQMLDQMLTEYYNILKKKK